MAGTWHDVGPVEELKGKPLREIKLGKTKIALSYIDGKFGAISGVCNHVGGPLGEGRIDGGYVVCPWHNWKFNCRTGKGEPGYETDCVPQYDVKVEKGRVLVNDAPLTTRGLLPHKMNPVGRPVERGERPIRVAGISTTAMDAKNPRFSTSDELLKTAIEHARAELKIETRLLHLNDLKFRHCEGYYSKSAHACTWPCSITQMDKTDQMDQVYEAVVHWADVILVSTSIRWGAASSLYYKMVERMNCVQNQITIKNNFLIHNKVAGFIITGGQDNIQAVAGQMLGFFAEIGCVFPPYPYIAHSRGWTAEDMERNVAYVARSKELHDGARELVERAVETAKGLLSGKPRKRGVARGGRKAQPLAPMNEMNGAANAADSRPDVLKPPAT